MGWEVLLWLVGPFDFGNAVGVKLVLQETLQSVVVVLELLDFLEQMGVVVGLDQFNVQIAVFVDKR